MNRFLLIICFQILAVAGKAQSLSLSDCRRMALEHNYNLQNTAIRSHTAQEQLKEYKANFFPKISASGNYLYSGGSASLILPGGYLPTFVPNPATGALEPNILMINPDGTPVFKEYAYMPDTEFKFKMGQVFRAGLSAEQPIYLGGKIQTSVRMAKIAATLAHLNTRKTEAEVMVQVDEAFFTCIQLEELVKSDERYNQVVTEFYRQMENAYHSGMKSKNDLLKVQIKRNEADLQLRQTQNGLRLARMNLCHSIGLPLTTPTILLKDEFEEEAKPTADPGNHTGESPVSARPEYAMLQQQVELKKQNVALVRSDFLPQIGAMASYSYLNGFQMNSNTLFSSPSFMGGISVNIPLFHWGEGRRKVSAARNEVEIARNQLHDLFGQMQLEWMQAANKYDEAVLEVSLTRNALLQAEENMNESSNRYQVGLETLADYLEAQALWQKAQSDHIRAKSAQRLTYSHYLKAGGNLTRRDY